jgi:hypothetical protein
MTGSAISLLTSTDDALLLIDRIGNHSPVADLDAITAC